jgi:Rrf2 family protein
MKLSRRGEYALRILIALGVARELGEPWQSIRELSEKEQIPQSFLEQILLQLKKAGYLESRRGVAGGYCLSRPAPQVRIGDVIRLVDGTLAPVSCVSRIDYAPCTCPDERTCGLRMLMEDVREAMVRVLDERTLADLTASVLTATRALKTGRGKEST